MPTLPTDLAARVADHVAEIQSKPVIKHEHQILNCISYWYPRLLADRRIPMPKTYIFYPDVELYELMNIFDGKRSADLALKFKSLASDINYARTAFGGKAFLRTGTFSGKHEWKETCFLHEDADIKNHLCALIEGAAMRDQALDVFAVRELLPTTPRFFAFYGDMPIVKERRFFARNCEILGHIPYWPEEAFERQNTSISDWPPVVADLARLTDEDEAVLTDLARYAAALLPGTWSIDFLQTKNGWYLTDCAIGQMSYGWRPEWDNG